MKKKFTLIELIIVIVVIGLLAAMALPKVTGIVKDAKVSAMINDKEVLEKMMILYSQKYDNLPLLNENQELIVLNDNISLLKLVNAEEVNDMTTIYTSMQGTLEYYNDNEENLYRIDLSKANEFLSQKLKYGHKKTEKDFYVYSTKTNNVYYYDLIVNGNNEIQHNEFNTTLKESCLVNKKFSYNLSEDGSIINSKPIVELTTDLNNITTNSTIKWTYNFIDEDTSPTKISFILNGVEYTNFDNIPTKLKDGEYTIKFRMQDSKGLWSDEVLETLSIIDSSEKLFLGYNQTFKITSDGQVCRYSFNTGSDTTTFAKNTKDISSSFQCTIALDSNGQIYGFGNNSNGELGTGDTTNHPETIKINLPNDIKAKAISTGQYHCVAVGYDDNLYAWGGNSYNQLGFSGVSKQLIPKKIVLPNNIKIKSAIAGPYNTIIIGSDDKVYVSGMFYSSIKFNSFTELKLPEGIKPISVYSGEVHSMILGDDGNLYAYGTKSLGTGSNLSVSGYATKVEFPKNTKIVDVSLGTDHSIAIDENNKIYTWGYNDYGQLGTGHSGNYTDKNVPFEIILPNGDIPKKVIAKYCSTVVLCENGNVYFSGLNQAGLFSTNCTNNYSTIFTKQSFILKNN